VTLQTVDPDLELPTDLLEMHGAYLRETAREPPGPETQVAFHLTSLLRSECTAVLFSNSKGEVVGYALYSVQPRYVYLRAFHIRKPYRGKGYGEQAIDRLRRELWRNVASIQIDVFTSDRGEIGFWEEMGFHSRSLRLELETATKSSTRKSCGAVVYRRSVAGPRYLLLKHINGDHWGFPKGHGAGDETEEETARREIFEETGLNVRFRPGFYERSHYLTPKSRKKEVVCFLARVRTKRVRIEPEEISDYRWLGYSAARELITFENTRVLLDKAHGFIKERGAKPF
jgi:bis(5'-nucleosidyl)-tetraphosphatase